MGLVKAIQHALNGDAILFLGSGASFGAKNIMGNDIISSGELSELIYPDCENLTQAVDLFLSQYVSYLFHIFQCIIMYLKVMIIILFLHGNFIAHL